MKRILFVDDDPSILQGLQRMLRSMRHEWDMEFAQGGLEALELIDRQSVDVIISDMRMPGMNGAQLLAEVRNRRPNIIRIILSGQSDQEAIFRSIGPTHQYLCKPCAAETLKSTVSRACALRDLLTNEQLQQMASRITSLPSSPALYCQLVKALRNPETAINQIVDIVAMDVGMAAKMLHLVNSAFFGLPRQVSDTTQAMSLIGLDTIKTLVLSFEMLAPYEQAGTLKPIMEALWFHSLKVGRFAREIAIAERQERRVVEEAFTAGLLHDVGKIALIANLPLQYAEVLKSSHLDRLPLWEAEHRLLGATHAEVGAYLMGLWGLPDPIIEALAYHHRPVEHSEQGFSPLIAVHVADALAHSDPALATVAPLQIDLSYLTAQGLVDRLPAWQQRCWSSETL